MIKITIDGIETEVPENMTVLEAAKSVGIDIPTLCFLKDISTFMYAKSYRWNGS